MTVSRLLGLMFAAAFVVLFLQSTPVIAGEHPWIENPALPPADTIGIVHVVIDPNPPELPLPFMGGVLSQIAPWWQVILGPEVRNEGSRVTATEIRSPKKMNLFGGVRATVTSPPK
ncbi:MAG: hypothetical protein PHR28_05550 [candidate division Zixibacteria bacterium]|nr:hypothetical protein [candidate division Zixibacteria bacterium]